MADQVTLNADTRSQTGRKHATRLRRDGRTPAVVYGHDVQATAVSLDARELAHALSTDAGLNVLIRLHVGEAEHLVITREVQRHPVREDIVHIDLLAVAADQLLDIEVPIHLVGDADVSRDTGGVVNHVLHTLPVRARPLDVPNRVTLSVVGMQIGDVRRAADVDLPAGSELNIDPDRTVVTINAPTILEEPSETEEVTLADLTEDELAELSEDERAALAAEAADAEDEDGDGDGDAGSE